MRRITVATLITVVTVFSFMLWIWRRPAPHRSPGRQDGSSPQVENAVKEAPSPVATSRVGRPQPMNPRPQWANKGGVPGPDGVWDYTKPIYHNEFDLGHGLSISGVRVIGETYFDVPLLPTEIRLPGIDSPVRTDNTYSQRGRALPPWLVEPLYLAVSFKVDPEMLGLRGRTVRELELQGALTFRMFRWIERGRFKEEWPDGVQIEWFLRPSLENSPDNAAFEDTQPIHPQMSFRAVVKITGLLRHMKSGAHFAFEAFLDGATLTKGRDKHIARSCPLPLGLMIPVEGEAAPERPRDVDWPRQLEAVVGLTDPSLVATICRAHLQTAPRSSLAHEHLSSALAAMGDYRSAWEHAQEAFLIWESRHPEDPDRPWEEHVRGRPTGKVLDRQWEYQLTHIRAARDRYWKLWSGQEEPAPRRTFVELEALGQVHNHGTSIEAFHPDCLACRRENEEVEDPH